MVEAALSVGTGALGALSSPQEDKRRRAQRWAEAGITGHRPPAQSSSPSSPDPPPTGLSPLCSLLSPRGLSLHKTEEEKENTWRVVLWPQAVTERRSWTELEMGRDRLRSDGGGEFSWVCISAPDSPAGSTWRELWVHDGGRWVPGVWPPLPAAAAPPPRLCPGHRPLQREAWPAGSVSGPALAAQAGPSKAAGRPRWPPHEDGVAQHPHGCPSWLRSGSTLGRRTALRSGGEASVLGAGWTGTLHVGPASCPLPLFISGHLPGHQSGVICARSILELK